MKVSIFYTICKVEVYLELMNVNLCFWFCVVVLDELIIDVCVC